MPYTTEDLIAVAPSDYELVTEANRAELHDRHAHPFTEEWRLRPGDLIWAPRFPGGDHLVVVWLAEQRAGLGRNEIGVVEGAIAIREGKPLLIGDDGKTYDLLQGRELRSTN